jgi:hypothetical protein
LCKSARNAKEQREKLIYGNEKKGIARVCFGRSFIPKATAETAATAVTAICFFYRPKMELREESKFMPMYYT